MSNFNLIIDLDYCFTLYCILYGVIYSSARLYFCKLTVCGGIKRYLLMCSEQSALFIILSLHMLKVKWINLRNALAIRRFVETIRTESIQGPVVWFFHQYEFIRNQLQIMTRSHTPKSINMQILEYFCNDNLYYLLYYVRPVILW